VSESIAVLHPAAIAASEEASAVVLLVFRIDGCEHAVAVEQVVEVLRMVAATPLPDAPPWVLGVINVRGRVIPLIDVRARLGAPRLEPEPSTSVIVVQTDEVAAGLVVDEVVEVLAVRHDALQRPDQVTVDSAVIFSRVQQRSASRAPAGQTSGQRARGRWGLRHESVATRLFVDPSAIETTPAPAIDDPLCDRRAAGRGRR
jgi:purine-binding chemotaxis protein CheW